MYSLGKVLTEHFTTMETVLILKVLKRHLTAVMVSRQVKVIKSGKKVIYFLFIWLVLTVQDIHIQA